MSPSADAFNRGYLDGLEFVEACPGPIIRRAARALIRGCTDPDYARGFETATAHLFTPKG